VPSRALASVVAIFAFVLLAPPLHGAAMHVAHADRVHFVGHLLAGRALSLLPVTSRLAEDQYARACTTRTHLDRWSC
jgi:hypothetical protein